MPPQIWSGYRKLIIIGAIVWLIGLAVLGLTRRSKRTEPTATVRPVTLADQLRPLAEKAIAGTLTTTERAALERSLMSYWQQKLDVNTLPPGEALSVIRHDPTAGPLFLRLERWLHRPGPHEMDDLETWLEPYTHIVAEESIGV